MNNVKKFYRIGNLEIKQGLWYDSDGNFTGLIHTKFDFCKNKDLPMPFDENVIGWLSATDTLEDLFNWFTKEDIAQLENHGYFITIYETTEYRSYHNHWVISQKVSKITTLLKITEIQ